METLISKIVNLLPEYFQDFGRIFVRPVAYIISNTDDSENSFQKALQFFAISICVSAILSTVVSSAVNNTDIWLLIVNRGIINISVILTTVCLLWYLFRLAGSLTSFRKYFVAYCYQSGVIVSGASILSMLAFGSILWFTGSISPDMQYMKGVDPTELRNYRINSRVFGYFFMSIWWLGTWDIWIKISGVGLPKSGRVFLGFAVLSIPLALVQNILLSALIVRDLNG